MRYLLDDNIPLSVKNWFREKGIEAVKLVEVGLKGADDEIIYEYAVDNNLKVITLDLDFGYIFMKLKRGTIIVLRPQKAVPAETISLLEKTFEVIKNKEGLIVVKPNKIRIIKP